MTKRLNFFSIITIVLLIMVGCGKSSNQGENLNKSGFLITQISQISGLVSCGNSKYAWVLKEKQSNQVFVLDNLGNIDTEPIFSKDFLFSADDITPAGDSVHAWINPNGKNGLYLISINKENYSPILENETIRNVFPAGDQKHAWILSSNNDLYLANTNGILLNNGQKLLQAKALYVFPAGGDGKQAWVQLDHGVCSITLKDDETIKISNNFLENEIIKNIEPAQDGRHAWVQTEDGFGLYLIDINGNVLNDKKKLLENEQINLISQAGDKKHLWVNLYKDKQKSELDKGLYLLSTEGKVLNGGDKILKEWEISEIFPVDDGKSAFVKPLSNGLYLLKINGERVDIVNNNKVLFGEEKQLRIINVGDKKHVWVKPSPGYGIYVANVNGDILNEKKWLKDILIVDVVPANDGRHGWVIPGNGNGIYLISIDNPFNENEYLDSRICLENIYPAENGKYAWVIGKTGSYIFNSPDELENLTLKFGGKTLDLKSKVEEKIDMANKLKINLKLLGISKPQAMKCGIRVEINDGNQRVGYGETVVDKSSQEQEMELALFWVSNINRNSKFNITVAYTDDLGSNLRVIWPRVKLDLPWVERKETKTIFLFLVLFVVLLILLLIQKNFPSSLKSYGRWLPFLFWSGSGVSGKLPDIMANAIDGNLLNYLLLITLLGFSFFWLISPDIFRALIDIQPFYFLAGPALSFRRVRRHVFSDYVGRLKKQIEEAKKSKIEEIYIELPIDINKNKNVQLPSVPTLTSQNICELLTNAEPSKRVNILIESPGGRGKTAFFRAVLLKAINEFENNPLAPIPIFCDINDKKIEELKSIEDLIIDCLGKFSISKDKDLVRLQLESGFFFLAIDGLSESLLDSSIIKDFVNPNNNYSNTKIILTSRPQAEYDRALEIADPLLIIEPKRLGDAKGAGNEKTQLEIFAAEYTKDTDIDIAQLMDIIKTVCKGPDNTYLPILVRFTIMAYANQMHINNRDNSELTTKVHDKNKISRNLTDNISLESIYRGTFQYLYRDDQIETVLKEVAGLCVATYWEKGCRTIASAGKEILIEDLRKNGVVIPVNNLLNLNGSNIYTEVKFVHASMQSYLTAYGLFVQDKWESLLESAGDPRFMKERSDMLTEYSTELFQMCLIVFRPKDVLRDRLQSEIIEWSNSWANKLTKDNITESIPEPIKLKIEEEIKNDINISVNAYINKVVDLCYQADREKDDVHKLGVFFSGLAPLILRFKRELEVENRKNNSPQAEKPVKEEVKVSERKAHQ